MSNFKFALIYKNIYWIFLLTVSSSTANHELKTLNDLNYGPATGGGVALIQPHPMDTGAESGPLGTQLISSNGWMGNRLGNQSNQLGLGCVGSPIAGQFKVSFV